MTPLTLEQTTTLKPWFLPERPGPLIGLHVIQTGNGRCFVDRWPEPNAVLIETAGNYTLLGNPQAVSPITIRPYLKGFIEASQAFFPLLKAIDPHLIIWPRVIYTQQQSTPPHINHHTIRRLKPSDTNHLQTFDPNSAWIYKTWGGPHGLARSGFAWGAFIDNQLASIACTFFLGEMYEEIGIVTAPKFRGNGLSTACAMALCHDIQTRGRVASWTTSPDNLASMRVAEKLGFVIQRYDQLYIVGVSLPE